MYSKTARLAGLSIGLCAALLALSPFAQAKPPWLSAFNSKYATSGSRLDTCGLCHLNFGSGPRNPYGLDFKNADGPNDPNAAFDAIFNFDSDDDGTTNGGEIAILFMPGISCANIGQTSGGPANLADYVDPSLPGCVVQDSDNDGVADNADNCVNVANATQLDTDGDFIGNICDGDFDQTCSVNFGDLGIMKGNFFLAGNLETDMNGDNSTNFGDLGVLKGVFFLPPGPSGLPNICAP